jgi:3-phenylpropionate/trans-cinnamate dioxygenase ferredoxin subunit
MLNYTQVPEDQVEFVHVANVGELDDEGRLLFEINGQPIALFMIADEIFAIADICSHDDGPLAEGDVEDHNVVCPRHGAHFDLRSGKALSLPAVVDIPAYPVKIDGEEILVGVPLEGGIELIDS